MKGKVESLSFPSYACLDLLTHLSYLSVKKKLNLAIFSENSYYHLMFYSLLTKYTLKVYFLFTMFEYFFSFATFSPLCDASFFSTPLSTQRNLKLKGKKHFAESRVTVDAFEEIKLVSAAIKNTTLVIATQCKELDFP